MRRSWDLSCPATSNPPAAKSTIMQPGQSKDRMPKFAPPPARLLFPQLKSRLLTQKVERVARERPANPRGPSPFWSPQRRFRQLLFRCDENGACALRRKTIRNITCCCTLCAIENCVTGSLLICIHARMQTTTLVIVGENAGDENFKRTRVNEGVWLRNSVGGEMHFRLRLQKVSSLATSAF